MRETSTPAQDQGDPIVRKTLRLPAALVEDVERIAAAEERDFSAQSRVALREHVERRQNGNDLEGDGEHG